MAIQEGGTWSPTNNIVSPGVFTRENDLSGLAQGIANIGAAVIAPMPDGPAFFPTAATTSTEVEKFGISDGTYYGPYTAMEYFKQQGVVTMVRVGGLTGYWQKNPLIVYARPGEWEKSSDVAELYNTSFMYVNPDSYTSSIKYVFDSAEIEIKPSQSFLASDMDEDEANDTISESFSNCTDGINVTGSLTELSTITSFLSEISQSVVSESAPLDNNTYTPQQYLAVSSSLLNAYANGTLITVSSIDIYKSLMHPNNEVYDNYFNEDSVANYTGSFIERSSGYDIAYFDAEKFNITGAIYQTADSTQSEVNIINPSDVTISESVISGSDIKDILNKGNYTSGSSIVYLFNFIDSGSEYSENITFHSYTRTRGFNICKTGGMVRYNTSYIESITGSVNASFGNNVETATPDCNYNGTDYTSDGESVILRGGEIYAGKQLNIGTIYVNKLVRQARGNGKQEDFGGVPADTTDPNKYAAGYFYISSSANTLQCTEEEVLATAIAESTSTTGLFSTSIIRENNSTSEGADCQFDMPASPHTDDILFEPNEDYFSVTSPVTVLNFKLEAKRDVDSCGVTLGLIGILSGSFGKFTGNFIPDSTVQKDPCNLNLTGRQPMILSVMANTLNGSSQWDSTNFEVYGFSGSTINPVVSSTIPYSGSINPTENIYQLKLAYNYVDSDSNNQSGTYGYYNFSLNKSDNNYIKDVFGTNPRVGDPEKQISGQKIEAAYNYLLFEDSINKFISEKTLASNRDVNGNTITRGWQLCVTTPFENNFSIGESLRFTDEYSVNLTAGDSKFAITNAYTPWIYSQKIASFKGNANSTKTSSKYKLFRVHTISDGTLSNQKYKIEISNVKLAGTVPGTEWGTFTLSVRKFSDTDKQPKVLETFQNLTLDPDSSNFIARRIGDYYAYITFAGKIIEFGTYENLSNYIRIEMTENNYPVSVVPYGFEAYYSPIGGTSTVYLPPVRYSKASIYGLNAGKYPSGTVFGSIPESSDELSHLYPTSSFGIGVNIDTKQWFKPLPYYSDGDQNGNNIDFDLEDKVYGEEGVSEYYAQNSPLSTGSLLDPSLSGSIPSVYDATNESTYVKMRKFVVGFQGGFDGQWPAIPINLGSDIIPGNTQGFDCTNINSPGSIAYKQCIAAIGNEDEFDINLIVTPGIFYQHHPYICDLIVETCERRGDCFYILDSVVFPKSNQSVGLINTAINCISTLDTNYAATYYPWIKILDTNTNKIVSVPPSVVMPAIYAQNDKSAATWYAPAGLNRGGISQAIQVLDRLTHSERDELYENRINPIAAFPGQGIVAWGQKTLQIDSSVLDRINVRRLLITSKKYIASASRYLVFEQNVSATRNKFISIADPYFTNIQQRNGLYAFKVIMDETNNTSDVIDRNILYGHIKLQPTKTSEFVMIDFTITPSGASFN